MLGGEVISLTDADVIMTYVAVALSGACRPMKCGVLCEYQQHGLNEWSDHVEFT